MRPIAAWKHLMSTTVSVAPRTGQSGYGKPTFGTAVPYTAHISRKRRIVRTAQGQEIVSEQALYLATTSDVLLTSMILMSTADVGSTETYATQPPVQAIERRFDQHGPHHVVVYL